MAQYVWDAEKKKAILASEYVPADNDDMFDDDLNGTGGNLTQSKFNTMTDEQLSEYAAMKGVDISKAKTREAAIAKLEKFEELG